MLMDAFKKWNSNHRSSSQQWTILHAIIFMKLGLKGLINLLVSCELNMGCNVSNATFLSDSIGFSKPHTGATISYFFFSFCPLISIVQVFVLYSISNYKLLAMDDIAGFNFWSGVIWKYADNCFEHSHVHFVRMCMNMHIYVYVYM